VVAFGETEHFSGTADCFEHRVKLFGLFGWTTAIFFAHDEECRGLAGRGICDGRTALIRFGQLVGGAAELAYGKCGANIGCAIKADPVGDRIFGDGRFEAMGMSYQPTGVIATGRQAATSEAIGVGEPSCNGGIDSGK